LFADDFLPVRSQRYDGNSQNGFEEFHRGTFKNKII
jgi:hypothetical protein